ncbi:hypothetical protein GGI11_000155 [Coemansia sp. RSA 2049]|nr:hypothetical protein H4217_000861 [Coemansia sp. RSA 1939]KAJ2525323.1 hypothetical protein GGI11_000155 [Coemansia sp. RSA 2049]KAJ2615893.1 hypothetical protein EV177_001344 [Coemansia sp. RSA 1804]KAJ2691678.1 hypothetical protein GGH99_002238 [Coemansia sp. RSA 1285]
MEYISQHRRRGHRILGQGPNTPARRSKTTDRQASYYYSPADTSTRFAATRGRMFESHSDLEGEQMEMADSGGEGEVYAADGLLVVDRGMESQPHGIYATEEEEGRRARGRHPRQPKTRARRQRAHQAQQQQVVPRLQGFFTSNFQSTWDIGALAILRGWRRMAQESQLRRDGLMAMWAEASRHRQRALVAQVLGKWQTATRKVLADPRVRYERTLVRMADAHYRTALLRLAVDRLAHEHDLHERLVAWTVARNRSTAGAALRAWRALAVYRKRMAIKTAFALVRGRQQRRYLAGVVHRLRARVAERRSRRESGHGTRILARERQTVRDRCQDTDYQQQHNHQQRRTIQNTEEEEAAALDEFMERRAAIQRNVLRGWRHAAREVADTTYMADLFNRDSVLSEALGALGTGAAVRREQRALADRFHRHSVALRSLGRLRAASRQLRDEQVQAHALRDWRRRNEQRRRRTLLLAWHTVVVKDHGRNEALADRLVARSNRRLVHECLSRWRSLYSGHAEADEATAHREQERQRRLAGHRGARRYADAQTMTSMVGSVPSVASDGESDADNRTTTVQLRERVRAAQDEADHYRALVAELDEAAIALHARMRELEPALGLWLARARLRAMAGFLAKARAAAQFSLRGRRAAETRMAAETRSAENMAALARVVGGWRAVVRTAALLDARAAAFTSSAAHARGMAACRLSIGVWRGRLKRRSQLLLAADTRCAFRLKQRVLAKVLRVADGLRTGAAKARDYAYAMLVVNFWTNLNTCMYHRRNPGIAPLLVDRGSPFPRIADSGDESDRTVETVELEQFSWNGHSDHPPPAAAVLGDPQSSGAGDYALTDAEENELAHCFLAWHLYTREIHDVQERVVAWLPPMFQYGASAAAAAAGGGGGGGCFAWELVYSTHLLVSCLRTWRARASALSAMATPKKRRIQESRQFGGDGGGGVEASDGAGLSGETDPARDAELWRRETLYGAAQARRTKRRVFGRWTATHIGSLFAKAAEHRASVTALAALTQHAARMARLRELERRLVGRRVLARWRLLTARHRLNGENAQVLASGSLARSCLLRWRSTLHQNAADTRLGEQQQQQREMYVAGLRFRWRSQARLALVRWMQACSADCVRVALIRRAPGAESARRARLADVAAAVYRRHLLAAGVLRRLRWLALRRRLHTELRMRFAAAWCSANTARRAVAVWRGRVSSPSSSMFFSAPECA